MQFICESCKANLQIADEKIRGKRLIVRCKRCGLQIRIVDPALVPSQSGGRPPTGPIRASPAAPSPAGGTSQSGGRPATGPVRTSQSGSRPSTGPVARAVAPRRETDTESTRAMDSEVLEKALRASKGEATAPASPAPVPRSAPPPPPREPSAPRDPAVWFAMIQGKQAGPITRAELALKASASQVGPRTYVWKDGMESWIRAKDVPELVPLFAAPPTPPPPPPDAAAAQRPEAGGRRVELPFESAAGRLTPPSARPAPAPAAVAELEEPTSPDAPTPPGGMRIPEEAGSAAAPAQPVTDRPAAGGAVPSPPGALDLARWGAAELSKPRAHTPEPLPKAPPATARELRIGQPERRSPFRALLVVLALALAGGLLAFALLSERNDRAPDPAQQGSAPGGPAQASPLAEGERKPEEKPAGTAPGDAPAAAPALSPEELKRKVDESKPVLQGCVDEAVKRDPSLHVGKILISATLAPSGAVTSARIEQKAVDQSPLGACLKSAARRMQFPPFAGEPFAVDIPLLVTGAP
jgi:predicted Zn finger-like uncharacterized protein